MLYMVALSIVLSPLLVFLYRRAVKRLMRLSSGEKEAGEGADRLHHPPPAQAGSAAEVPQGLTLQGATLMERMAQRRTRVAIAYGVAGACHAAVLTTIFATRHWDILTRMSAQTALLMVSLVALMFCLPALLTLEAQLSAFPSPHLRSSPIRTASRLSSRCASRRR